jgi:hypothetical protein
MASTRGLSFLLDEGDKGSPGLLVPVRQGEGSVGRNNKHMVWQNIRAILRFGHGHDGALANQLGKDALVVRRKMLDKHESHAAVGRHMLEKGPESFKAARRSDLGTGSIHSKPARPGVDFACPSLSTGAARLRGRACGTFNQGGNRTAAGCL